MRSNVRSTGGRGRRVLATALLLTLPLSVAACSDDDNDGIGTDDGPVEEIQEEDTDEPSSSRRCGAPRSCWPT